jgi:hypothetical protein
MVTVEVLASFVLAHFPLTYCPSCIAERLGADGKDVREAMQLLVLLPGFGANRHTCYGCRRIDDIAEKRA